jgi:hypothetical protein
MFGCDCAKDCAKRRSAALAKCTLSLDTERVQTGLRNARAKGTKLGRPRLVVDAVKIGCLHFQSRSITRDCPTSLVAPAVLSTKPLRTPSLGVLQSQQLSNALEAVRKSDVFDGGRSSAIVRWKNGANRARTGASSVNFLSETGRSVNGSSERKGRVALSAAPERGLISVSYAVFVTNPVIVPLLF